MPDPRTPVLVGAAAVEQRAEDPVDALEALELMVAASDAAATDAGSMSLLERIDLVMSPRGFWGYADPGSEIARRVGASARTVVAEVGVLQTTLFARASEAIRDGAADVVLVVGAEARHRAQQARRAGVEVHDTDQGDIEPDEVWRPADDILERVEIERNLAMPVHQYAVMENAWRAAEGMTVAEHLADLDHLWSVFQQAARSNPHAWSTDGADADLLAFPYTKQHVSQWNVDQAAGLILCSEETARALGLPADRRVYPHAIVNSDEMVPLVRRRALHRVCGFEVAAPRALELAACDIDDVAHLELYSCFPIAVRVQQAALGTGDRVPTVSGGMAFAGGPLNNFVLQAMVRMVEVMRESRGRSVVTAVSGMLTKQGVAVWGMEPPAAGFASADVSAAAEVRGIDPDITGDAVVAGYTVVHDRAGPQQGIAVCDVGDLRTVASTTDPDLMASMEHEEWCGRTVHADGGLLSAS